MPWAREEKIFCIVTNLEAKSFKAVLKKMQPINMIMIYYWNKKFKERFHVLEADIITIDVVCLKDAFFTGHVPNNCHYACHSHKSL